VRACAENERTGECPILDALDERESGAIGNMGKRTDMNGCSIELIYFDGCPNAERARENLRTVLGDDSWTEWNLSSANTPKRFRRYGSPTVLVDGRDVTGDNGGTDGMACRADGAPSPELIREVLSSLG